MGVAVVVSGVVTRLGQQVSRARELGSYRLGELLGRGGMGEVYLATHRMLARPAAIKLIRPEVLAGEDGTKAELATARFRREAEAAARLKSPHTVQLYDFGVTDEGRLYLVMELLDGLDLDSLVRRDGPLTAARVVHILRQVCESLEEAHDAGLVHRDIKPANIHLGRVGREPDFVKVLDFGLVKSVESGGGEDPLATIAGMTLGTAPDDVHAHPAGAGAAVAADGEPDPPGAGAADSHLSSQAPGGPAGQRGRPGRRTGRYASTSTLNPPYAIRFMSNGIGTFIIFAMRGSFITFAFTRSRWARDLYTIHEKQTVSPLFTLASRGKAIPIFVFRSSPTHSRYSRAPCSRQSFPARCAMRR
jgi:serine/threonine protein kinase